MIFEGKDIISLLYDGKPLAQSAKKTEEKNNNTVTAVYDFGGLTVTNKAKKYEDFGVYEWVNTFENKGSEPSGIVSEFYDGAFEFEFEKDEPSKGKAYIPDYSKHVKVIAPTGSQWTGYEFYCDEDEYVHNDFKNHLFIGRKRVYKTNGGRSSNARAPFFNVHKENKGFILAIGWTGQWLCEFERTEKGAKVGAKIEDTHFRVLPGETIRTASIFVMPYEGEVIEAQNKWRRFIKAHISPIGKKPYDDCPPLCTSIWGGMDTDEALKRINRVKQYDMPFDYIWMDAGWYGTGTDPCPDEFEGDWFEHSGDWRINVNRHPDGLLDVAKAIKDAGKKYLLWFEPERVRKNAPIVAEHPEYFIDTPYENDMNMLLYLGNEEAWKYCYNTMSDIIAKLDVKFYRQDFNFEPLEFWRKNDTEDRQGITEIKHINGLYKFWDALQERFPGLMIDNCASGGRRIDMETLRRSIPLWRSDATCPANPIPEITQAHSLCFGLWMPYSGTSAGRNMTDLYSFRSAYAPALVSNATFSANEDYCATLEEAQGFKRFLNEYLRVRPYLSEDIYPLTEPNIHDDNWSAVQYHRPENNDGIIQVFRRDKSPYVDSIFFLHGIDPEKTYTFSDGDNALSTDIPGKNLIEDGFFVRIAKTHTSKIFFYREATPLDNE